MKNFTNKDILSKYINNDCSFKEEALIRSWLSENGNNAEIKSFVKNDWYKYLKQAEQEDKNLDHILNKVHHTLRTQESKNNKRFQSIVFKWYSAAAAVLFIPFITLFFYLSWSNISGYNSKQAEDSSIKILCPRGSKMAFSLPDGTQGMLNSGSSIQYSVPFSKDRIVYASGEVYFDVFHNKKRPFIVNANQSKITVLGTSFNVKAYPEDSFTEIVLAEGKIKCETAQSPNSIYLIPGDKLLIENDKIKKSIIDVSTYTSWKDGLLVFRGESMQEAIKKLSRWYNVQIEVMDDEIWSYSFNGTFLNDSLEEVLKLLKMTSPMEYKLLPREKNEDGSWKQRKVELFKQKT